MENTVVVGGAVSGNISSCEFKVSSITTGRKNLWVETKQTLGVNNCTGEIIRGNTWELTFDGIIILVFIIIFIAIIGHYIEESL